MKGGATAAAGRSPGPARRLVVRARAIALVGALPTAALAQAPPRPLADTQDARAALDAAFDSAIVIPDDGLAADTRQAVVLSGLTRRYRVGATVVRENAAPLSWRFTSPRIAARISATPLALDAVGTTLRGTTPFRGRLDVVLRAGDTISVYGRSASGPRALDSTQALAVGAAGTSVIDLESPALGLAPQVGARGRFSVPVGDMVLGMTVAAERDLPPPATGATYWQGTTLRGGASLTGFAGEQTITVGADVSYSRADSLGGRNQFPGGGAVTLSAATNGTLGTDGEVFVAGDVFYVQPFGNDRNDQPTLLIPQGTFAGVNGMAAFDTGPLTWSPSLALLREASAATVTVQQGTLRTRSSLDSRAWTLSAGLSVDIPLGATLTLTPEVGGVVGSVGATLAETTGSVLGRRGRTSGRTTTSGFSDPVRGWWGGVSVRIRR